MNNSYPNTEIDLDKAKEIHRDITRYLSTERFFNGIRREVIKTKPKFPCSICRRGKAPNGIEYIAHVWVPKLDMKQWMMGVMLIDHTDDGSTNLGIVSIMPDRVSETDITFYVKGHAFDRYCERYLKKPAGYKLTDKELADIVINKMLYFNSYTDPYTNEVQIAFDGGTLLGYRIKDTSITVVNTFVAVHNYYPNQSIMKRTLDQHQQQMINQDKIDYINRQNKPNVTKGVPEKTVRFQLRKWGLTPQEIDKMMDTLKSEISESIARTLDEFDELND